MISDRDAATRVPHAKIFLKREGESDRQAIKASAPSFSTLSSITNAVRDLFPEFKCNNSKTTSTSKDKICFAIETNRLSSSLPSGEVEQATPGGRINGRASSPSAKPSMNTPLRKIIMNQGSISSNNNLSSSSLGLLPSSTLVGCVEGQTLVVFLQRSEEQVHNSNEHHHHHHQITRTTTPKPSQNSNKHGNKTKNAIPPPSSNAVNYFTPAPHGASSSRLLSQRHGVEQEKAPSPNRSFSNKKNNSNNENNNNNNHNIEAKNKKLPAPSSFSSPFHRTGREVNQSSSSGIVASPTPNYQQNSNNNDNSLNRFQYYEESRKRNEEIIREKKLLQQQQEQELLLLEQERQKIQHQHGELTKNGNYQRTNTSWGEAAVELPSFPSASEQRLTSQESNNTNNNNNQNQNNNEKQKISDNDGDFSIPTALNSPEQQQQQQQMNTRNSSSPPSRSMQRMTFTRKEEIFDYNNNHDEMQRNSHQIESESELRQQSNANNNNLSSFTGNSFVLALGLLRDSAKQEFDDFLFLSVVAKSTQPGATDIVVRKQVRMEMKKLEHALNAANGVLIFQEVLEEERQRLRTQNILLTPTSQLKNNHQHQETSFLGNNNTSPFSTSKQQRPQSPRFTSGNKLHVNPYALSSATMKHNEIPKKSRNVSVECEEAFWNLTDALAGFRLAAKNAFGEKIFEQEKKGKHGQSEDETVSKHQTDASFTTYMIGRKSLMSQEERNLEILKREFLVLLADLVERQRLYVDQTGAQNTAEQERQRQQELALEQERQRQQELALEQERQRQQELADEQERQRQQELAHEQERQRQQELALEQERQRQQELADEQERQRQQELANEQERQRQQELADEQERQRQQELADEQERQRQQELALEQERQRQQELALEQERQRQQELALEQERQRQQELADEQERQRQQELADEQERQRQQELVLAAHDDDPKSSSVDLTLSDSVSSVHKNATQKKTAESKKPDNYYDEY